MVDIPLKILIVEDSESGLELILHELNKGGFQFSYKHCQTEEKFNKLLIHFEPDIILSDHNLPVFNSTDALIKARKYNPHIPFILVSGYIGEDEAVDMIVNKGANDFILKNNLLRLNPAIVREIKNYKLKFELEQKTKQLKRLSMVASHTHNGVIITNEKGEIEWVNDAYTKITGYSLNECFGQKPGHILQGKDTDPKAVGRIRKKLKTLKPFKEEILNYHKNGTPYWIKLDITPILDGFGELTNFIATQEDITAEKEHEKLMIAINDITTSLLDTNSFSEICNTVTEKLIHHFGFNDCVVYEADNEQKKLIQIAATGEKRSKNKPVKDPLVLDFGQGIVGSVAESKKPEIVVDTSRDNRYVVDNKKRLSEIAVPIILDHQVIGVLDSEHPNKNFYTNNHLKQLETIAGVIASKFKAAQENRQKKRIEEELRKSEQQLKQITSNIDVAVTRYEIAPSGEGKITYASPKTKDIFEIEPEQALKDDSLIWDQIVREDFEHVNNVYKGAISKKDENVFYLIFRVDTPSGVRKWIESSGTITYLDDGTVISDTINRDITRRVKSEQKIINNEQLLSSLTKNIPGVIIRYSLHADGTDSIDFMSDRSEDIYELTSDEIIADNRKIWDLIFSEDAEKMILSLEDSAKKLSPWAFEYRIKAKSGKLKWLRASGTPRKTKEDSVTWDTVVLDISKEKFNEESLRKTNERLTEAQNLAKIGDWEINMVTGETYISSVIKEIYEVEHNFVMEEGITYYKDGYSRDKIEEVVGKAIQDGTPYSEDLLLITGKGNEKWVRSQGEAEFENGECVRLYGTLRDINTEKEAELEIKKTNKRLLEAQKLAQIGDWSFDFTTNEMFISPVVKEIHEVDMDHDWDIDTGLSFFKEGFNRRRKEFVVNRAINKGVPYNEELLIVTKKGNERWVRTIGESVFENGKCIRLNGTLMDITDEKILRDSLEENQQRLDAAITGADLGIWDFNIKTGINLTNTRYKEALGYSEEEFEETFDFFLALVHPEDRPLIHSEVDRIESGDIQKLDIIVRLKHKDGHYRTFLDRGRAVEFDDNGKLVRMIGTIFDITEQYTLQKKLEESLNEKTILLTEIHHRVKNNLAIVSGLLDLQAFESEDKTLKSTLMDVGQRIRSIAGVHELLYEGDTFSEIGIKEYIERLLKNINISMLDGKNVAFNISIDENVIININQAVPIGLLLNELMTNSFKYAFKTEKHPKIKFSIFRKDNIYFAEYSDNGPGIDPDQIKNPKSLGMTLINTLLLQLNADFKIQNKKGFNLVFNFIKQNVGAHSNLRK